MFLVETLKKKPKLKTTETIQTWEELVAKDRANIDVVPVCIGPDFPRVGLGSFDSQDEVDIKNRSAYNVTLLNFMDPQKMPYLKEEPYFGMGKMAVSWHHDENLVDRSAVAVYSYSCEGTVRSVGQLPECPRLELCVGSGRTCERVCMCMCVCEHRRCVSFLGSPQLPICRTHLFLTQLCRLAHCHFVPPGPSERCLGFVQ